ncbi:S8 family peptidase [Evansella sp. AB-P1]|uniref:S8 family peptidase n=1 Tax=Evansella sp. AB-P1 TaxID=3037653 RepID=UPI00241D4D7B|nr:S8 family peptidase [Evansella sp. AB-P1]MDG5787521.1 S8 family peptidase [Evansella sp. AB-P1]
MWPLRRLTIIFSIVLLMVLGIWFVSDHQKSNDFTIKKDEPFRAAMDELLAEDLVGSIQMFLHQIEDDLIQWKNNDWNNEELKVRMKQEVEDHPHVDGFIYRNEEKEEFMIGEVARYDENDFIHVKNNGIKFSDPFVHEGKHRMVMGVFDGNKDSLVAELNLSFIESFIKDVASLSDSNGQFFIGNNNIDVSLTDEEAEIPYTKKEVPELGWNLFLQREDSIHEDEEHFKQGELIVELKNNVDEEQWLIQNEVSLIDRINSKMVVRSHTNTTEQLMENLARDQSVNDMEPNYMYSKQTIDYEKRQRRMLNYFGPYDKIATPNDEFYEPYQWNLTQIFAEDAWKYTVGQTRVPIAIIDSGIDPEHLDLSDKIVDGYNAFDDSNAYNDEHGHGTHVAGISAAITNNIDGVAGVSWNNPILAVKALDDNAEGSSLSIAKGIIWAVEQGAKVINLSLGDSHDSDVMYEAIKYAYDNDVVLIAASGNDNVDTPMYPAAYKEVLAVGAVDINRERAFFSNYGNHLDVTAPGEHIPSTFLGNQYVMMSGTSMAAPHVAGMAGLIRSVDPTLSNDEIYELIMRTSDDLGKRGYDPFYGFGEINIKKALEEIL